MNYKLIYDKIILNAQQRDDSLINEKYFENHHIIPKCMGGTDNENNIVRLTLREHYICHKLLTKIYPDNKKIIHAFWMITITTLGALKSLYENNLYKPDGEMINRIKHFMYDENKIRISSRDYQYAKTIFTNMMNGHIVSDETKAKISQNTKQGMLNANVIKKCKSGSAGCHFYRNKETGKVYKWFPGDSDIDLSLYEWGRGPISNKQRMNQSKIKQIDKTYWYNKELNIKYCVYKDYINDIIPNGWIYKNPPSNTNNNLYKNFIKDLENNLIDNNKFELINKIYYKANFTTKKPRKIISPIIFELCFDQLKKYKENNDIEIINDTVIYIENNIDKVNELIKKYIK